MGGFSIWHILIFAIILLLLFGGNRFSAMMGDVAKGLKASSRAWPRRTRTSGRSMKSSRREPPRQLRDDQRPSDTIDVTPRPSEPAAPPPRDDETR